jgi:hypothetical protein
MRPFAPFIDSLSPVHHLFLLPIFLGTASGQFLRPAASRLLLSRFRPYTIGFPPIKQPLALEAEATRFWVPRENGARKRRKFSYVLPITLVGFVGSDPEQRQAKGNGSKFTVLSIATQRSWKNADDEWSSKTEWHRAALQVQ